ncbi:MAG: hypothetical protein AAGI92_06255 [Pseudomonadota bacterium]
MKKVLSFIIGFALAFGAMYILLLPVEMMLPGAMTILGNVWLLVSVMALFATPYFAGYVSMQLGVKNSSEKG